MAGSDDWWADETVDWTRPEPAKVRDILKSAYPAPEAVIALAGKAGMPTSGADVATDSWSWAIDTAVTGGWLLRLYEAVLTDPSKEPFHLLLYRGLFPDTGSGLQTINALGLGFSDALMDEQVARDGRRRTAMIEIGGRPAGTAFLVGPDLLLTAAHVLDPLRSPPQPGGAVIAVFDFLPQAGRSRAETGVRVIVSGLDLAGSLPTASEIANKASDWNATESHLDFALIRLARNMSIDEENGLRRGFYELYKEEYAFAGTDLLRIVQHPLGQTLQVSRAAGPFQVNANKTRVRYVANTLGGSSGSAVVDMNGRLVALHHFAGTGFNQGVLIDRIAAGIAAKVALPRLAAAAVAVPAAPAAPGAAAAPAAAAVAGPDPFQTLGFGLAPFAGRSGLRAIIKAMLDGNERRILVLEGGQDAGKTYSHRYLTYLQAKQGHPAVRGLVKGGLRIAHVDLDVFVTVPREELHERIVRHISSALQLGPESTVAQPVRRITDLVTLLAGMPADAGVISWIFVDSLDRHNLEQGQVRELIVSLLKLVDGNEAIPLRLVLSSRPPTPVAQEFIEFADRDKPRGLDSQDIKDWLSKSAQAKGRSLDDAKLALKVNEIIPPGTFPSARSLAPALPQALRDLLEAPA